MHRHLVTLILGHLCNMTSDCDFCICCRAPMLSGSWGWPLAGGPVIYWSPEAGPSQAYLYPELMTPTYPAPVPRLLSLRQDVLDFSQRSAQVRRRIARGGHGGFSDAA